MTDTSKTVHLDQEVARYKQAIELLERHQDHFKDEIAVEVLVARDAIHHLMDDSRSISEHSRELRELDTRLRSLGPKIAQSIDLEHIRETLNRSAQAWWWTFELPVDSWDKYDWVWHAMTTGMIILAASVMVNIYSAYAMGNATIATALSTIVQVAGLAVIGQGALTAGGQAKVQKILASVHIPPRFYAESTFLTAMMLCLAVFYTNSMLDDTFFKHGERLYDRGYLNQAELAYRQGLDIDPNQLRFHRGLGQVYESLGNLEQAFHEYLVSASPGDVTSLNNLGRVTINRADPTTGLADPILAEAYLLLGLQRAQTDESENTHILYQLNRNIGWALIQQEKYEPAIEYLETALKRLKEFERRKGAMGNCFLAYAYEKKGEIAKANTQWRMCIQYGAPNFVHEFRWLISVGRNDIAYCVNTAKVVGEYNESRTPDVDEWCDRLYPVAKND